MKEIKITVQGKQYDVKVGDLRSSPVEVVVDEKTYQVEIESVAVPQRMTGTKSSTPVTSAPASISSPHVVAGAKGVRAPMPGTIVSVDVHPGEKVTRGQQLVSLEAMKMKNSIKSPVDAVIKTIQVTDGQKVQYNDLLVSFEE